MLWPRSFGVFALVVLFLVFVPGGASAHTLGLSTGEYAAQGDSVVATLSFARADVIGLVPGLDADQDGHVAPSELASGRVLLERRLVARIAVTRGGGACHVARAEPGLTEEDGFLVEARWDCPSSEGPFTVDLRLLGDLPRGHRHVAHVVGATGEQNEVLSRERSSVVVPEPRAQRDARSSPSSAQHHAPSPRGASGLLLMGIEHILGGLDHLVFLFGLVLVRTSFRSLFASITAFTVAHSAALAMAVIFGITPPASWVEPAVALSIVYVGIESFFLHDGRGRYRVTFPFGFVHGFAFAEALRELAISPSSAWGSLAMFNLGVEIGQCAVLAVFLPILFVARWIPFFSSIGVKVLSLAIAAAGFVWFTVRVRGG